MTSQTPCPYPGGESRVGGECDGACPERKTEHATASRRPATTQPDPVSPGAWNNARAEGGNLSLQSSGERPTKLSPVTLVSKGFFIHCQRIAAPVSQFGKQRPQCGAGRGGSGVWGCPCRVGMLGVTKAGGLVLRQVALSLPFAGMGAGRGGGLGGAEPLPVLADQDVSRHTDYVCSSGKSLKYCRTS